MTHVSVFFFFFNDTATTEIYTLSLHDALPIFVGLVVLGDDHPGAGDGRALFRGYRRPSIPAACGDPRRPSDRKSTRLNSSHANISYAVFCLKKKKNIYLISLHISTLQSYSSFS